MADVEAGRADYFARVPPALQARLIARYGAGSPYPDPSQFAEDMFAFYRPITGFLDRTRLGRRIRDVGALPPARWPAAYAGLDRDIAAEAAPFAPVASATRTDFFSDRIGCQAEHPLYGIDLAALCSQE